MHKDSLGEFSEDASTLGWPPGHWPPTTLFHGRMYYRRYFNYGVDGDAQPSPAITSAVYHTDVDVDAPRGRKGHYELLVCAD